MLLKFSKPAIVNIILYLGIGFSVVLLGFSVDQGLLHGQSITLQILMVYLGLPLLLLVAFCAVLTWNVSDKVQFLLFVFLTVFFLYTAETILFLKKYSNEVQSNIRQAKKEGKTYDTRNLTEVIVDLRSQGTRAFPSFMPRQFVYSADQYPQLLGGIDVRGKKIFPLGGVSHATIVSCNEGGSWMTYPSDEYGFNNPLGLYKHGLDMVALGDSYAEGH